MSDLSGLGAPTLYRSDVPNDPHAEVQAWHAIQAPQRLAPRIWVPREAEEAFYRLNNLPLRLTHHFADVLEHDPDEDDVEDLIDDAQTLIRQHSLMDVWVDALYQALDGLPATVRVRRLGQEGVVVKSGRPTLLAVRDTWLKAWTLDAVLQRLRASGSVALEAAPLVIHADDQPLSEATHGSNPSDLDTMFVDAESRVTRVASSF